MPDSRDAKEDRAFASFAVWVLQMVPGLGDLHVSSGTKNLLERYFTGRAGQRWD